VRGNYGLEVDFGAGVVFVEFAAFRARSVLAKGFYFVGAVFVFYFFQNRGVIRRFEEKFRGVVVVVRR
jgi:hypothetical protein